MKEGTDWKEGRVVLCRLGKDDFWCKGFYCGQDSDGNALVTPFHPIPFSECVPLKHNLRLLMTNASADSKDGD